MFVGHYGFSFAARNFDRTVPLWHLFVAVQLVDFGWAFALLLGIEQARILPRVPGTAPLDLHYMPFTHSLLAVLIWSVATLLLYWRFCSARRTRLAGVLVALGVLSHWVFDVPVHPRDLPLWGDVYKVGFGLWTIPGVGFVLETIVLIAGVFIYLRTVPRVTSGCWLGAWGLALGLVVVDAAFYYGPFPQSTTAIALGTIVTYVILTWAAWRLDRAMAAAPVRQAAAPAG